MLVTDTPQGNPSRPQVHPPKAFAVHFKNKLWNAVLPLNFRHENPGSPLSSHMMGFCSIISIFRGFQMIVLTFGCYTFKPSGSFQTAPLSGPHPRPTRPYPWICLRSFPGDSDAQGGSRNTGLGLNSRSLMLLLMLVLNKRIICKPSSPKWEFMAHEELQFTSHLALNNLVGS